MIIDLVTVDILCTEPDLTYIHVRVIIESHFLSCFTLGVVFNWGRIKIKIKIYVMAYSTLVISSKLNAGNHINFVKMPTTNIPK